MIRYSIDLNDKLINRFLNSYKSNGIEFWGMTVENEPKAGFNPNYLFNCLGFTAENERDFVKKDLGPALEQAGYGRDKLTLMIYDDGRNDQMIDWIDTCFNDTETAKYVHGIEIPNLFKNSGLK